MLLRSFVSTFCQLTKRNPEWFNSFPIKRCCFSHSVAETKMKDQFQKYKGNLNENECLQN